MRSVFSRLFATCCLMWLSRVIGKVQVLNGVRGSMNGTEFVYQQSHNQDASRGIALILHGCYRSSLYYWTKSERCEKCIGGSVMEKITETVLSMNFFVIAVSSANRQSGCFSRQDIDPINQIIPYIYETLLPKQNIPRRLPLFLIATSGGAKFASAYPTFAQKTNITIDGVVLMNSGVYGVNGNVPQNFPLIAHINMANSPNAPQYKPNGPHINAQRWLGLKLCNQSRYHYKEYIAAPKKVTPEYMSQFDIAIPNVIAEQQKFIEAMTDSGNLTADGFLVEDPKLGYWISPVLARFPELAELNVSVSRIGDILHLAYAGHMHTFEFVSDALTWMLRMLGMVRPQPHKISELAKNGISHSLEHEQKLFRYRSKSSKGELFVSKKPLLCVTFVQAFNDFDIAIASNNSKRVPCDWAFVIYGDDVSYGLENTVPICNINSRSDIVGDVNVGRVVYCKRSMFSLSDVAYIQTVAKTDTRTGSKKNAAIVQPVMYLQLAPIIQKYERVVVSDSDISYVNFDYSSAARVWNEAYTHPPMIVQPLLSTESSGGNQKSLWVKEDIDAVMAGCLSQQVAFLDSSFLHWYITKVLVYTIMHHLIHSSACGWDDIWCPAAKWYGEAIAGYSQFNVPCAILTNSSNVAHHLNTKSSGVYKSKYDHLRRSKRSCRIVKSSYEEVFPRFKSQQSDANYCVSVQHLKSTGTAVTLSRVSKPQSV